MNLMDPATFGVVGGVLAALGLATGAGQLLKRQSDLGLNPALIEQFNLRVRAWWILCAVLMAALLLGHVVTVILFGLISFWALREFITLTPTRTADHRALFWVFFVFTPLQYVLVGIGDHFRYSIVIPVYAFLFIPARIALAGDYKRYLERCAKIQAGLMICVYCLSFAPALLTLDLGDENRRRNTALLFFFVLVVTLGDAFRYVCERLIGRHVIAPAISAQKTWEGAAGGVACATLAGAALWWFTPLDPWLAAAMSLVIAVMGFFGGLTMSAIKRDRGVRDYGTLIEGHGGVLDRIDSICFAAPVFFHLTRFLYANFPEVFEAAVS
jgi:phosphatidate cytidylyltransferase